MLNFILQSKNKVAGLLALSGWLATIGFIAWRLPIPDAWWGIIGSLTTYYFVQQSQLHG